MIYQGEQYRHSTDPNKLFRVSRPLWVLLRSVAFYHGSELTSTAADDKGIVQFDHKFLHFF